jgi:hypothetical protein
MTGAVTLDAAVTKFLDIRKQIDAIERETKAKVAPMKESLAMLEAWITREADAQGLKTVATKAGTGYWSTHATVSIADGNLFWEYVRNNDAWELVEKRASKTGVEAHIQGTGEAPPGLNINRRRVFNVRSTQGEQE